MNKILNCIRRTNYAVFFKWWLILGLCIGLLGSGLSALLLRPQLQEAAVAIEARDQQAQTSSQENHSHHGEHDWEALRVSEPSIAAKLSLGITAAAAVLFAGAYWLAIAGWVSQSADAAGMNGILWGFLALAGNLAAVVLFILIRSFLRQKCGSCGKWQRRGPYCSACGAKLELHCPACGGKCTAGSHFCSSCGTSLDN